MHRLCAALILLTAVAAAPLQANDVPRRVSDFVLGEAVAASEAHLQMDTVLPLRYQEYLEEVEIASRPGFKSGLIAYGTCAQPGRIVRIKLKYADASRAFYDALLSRVEQRFGKPSAYEGDPFHIVMAWKWSFTDADGNQITLHLSHNNRDRDEKFGNAVKLTLVSGIERERQCYLGKHPQAGQGSGYQRQSLKSMRPEDWERFLPR